MFYTIKNAICYFFLNVHFSNIVDLVIFYLDFIFIF